MGKFDKKNKNKPSRLSYHNIYFVPVVKYYVQLLLTIYLTHSQSKLKRYKKWDFNGSLTTELGNVHGHGLLHRVQEPI